MSECGDIGAVLELGRYSPVRSTGTSDLYPSAYRYFLLRTGTSYGTLLIFVVFMLSCNSHPVGGSVDCDRLEQARERRKAEKT